MPHDPDTLTVRRDEIADAIEDEPAAPSPATLDRIREHLARVIADGSSAERKATIEQLIAEIRITEDDKVIPVFRVPGPDDAVRAMPRLVGRPGLEPGTYGVPTAHRDQALYEARRGVQDRPRAVRLLALLYNTG